VTAAVSATLAAVFHAERHQLNERFAAARVRHPDLDAEAFAAFIRGAVDPLVGAVARTRFDRVTGVTLAAYDIALELVGQKLVGRSARTPHVGGAWRRILPEVASLVAEEPQRVIGAVCNASHHVSLTPGARPGAWIDLMVRLAGQCSDTATFLTLGQVAAWRAGMAHFRESALAVAAKLPESLALAAIGAPGTRWPQVRDRLEADPWYDPAAPNDASATPRVVARVGAFRGFGGLFTETPAVAMADGQLFVRGGSECWLLTADAFGATFHRVAPEDFDRARGLSALPEGISVRAATATVRGCSVSLPSAFAEVTSACASGTTLALTAAHTHAILLVALPVA
jgi:hypothetical protein